MGPDSVTSVVSMTSMGLPACAGEASDVYDEGVVGPRGRSRISTGYVRPDTSMTGAGSMRRPEAGVPSHVPKWRAKRSESIVAEVMMTFRSGRAGSRRAT